MIIRSAPRRGEIDDVVVKYVRLDDYLYALPNGNVDFVRDSRLRIGQGGFDGAAGRLVIKYHARLAIRTARKHEQDSDEQRAEPEGSPAKPRLHFGKAHALATALNKLDDLQKYLTHARFLS